MNDSPFIRVRGLSKSYGGVHALRKAHIEIAKGEVHALCGENGAGKSTLIKSLTGVVTPDEGSITIEGKLLPLGNVQETETAGVAVIHQESTAFPNLNTLDNIFVGREPRTAGGWFLDKARMRREAAEVLRRLGQDFDMDCPVGELSVAQRQMVAMARALSRDCRFLILDEPTASLSARETNSLLKIVKQLRSEGVTIL
ncbi:MAG: sugar ABC transporter ATP-binding protein, partial [Verrucomicrobiae bacterium]|nr:sugar ABC transporter ATP-binding protein [Verrucomicrobiae bacterium]